MKKYVFCKTAVETFFASNESHDHQPDVTTGGNIKEDDRKWWDDGLFLIFQNSQHLSSENVASFQHVESKALK